MAIVRQFDKRTGKTYVYESTYYWDAEKRQSRARRKCIGKLDAVSGKVVATRQAGEEPSGSRLYLGATWLLEQIAESTGVSNDLKAVLDTDRATKVLSIAMFLCCEDTPAYRFKAWSARHRHPYGKDIPSQRVSELLTSITPDECFAFFKAQAAKRAEGEYWAYDTTSISSHSELLEPVVVGYNKEGDNFGQFNLLLLFGETSNLPFYYRTIRGNIPDVSTVETMVNEAGLLGIRKAKYCMDRGFYSKTNIDALYNSNSKFLLAGRTSLAIVQKVLTSDIRASLRTEGNLLTAHDVYGVTVLTSWETKRADGALTRHRLYVHIYHDPARAAAATLAMDTELALMRRMLESGEDIPAKTPYRKYFEVRKGHGISVKLKEDMVKKAQADLGWFVLFSNDVKNAGIALDIYRNRDLVEKAFGDLKGRLNFRRPRVQSTATLDGKLFIEFIALILLSYIKKRMQDNNLFDKYTLPELLDELDVIESVVPYGRKKTILHEITKQQINIYQAMGVNPPTMLR
jgi:transposase